MACHQSYLSQSYRTAKSKHMPQVSSIFYAESKALKQTQKMVLSVFASLSTSPECIDTHLLPVNCLSHPHTKNSCGDPCLTVYKQRVRENRVHMHTHAQTHTHAHRKRETDKAETRSCSCWFVGLVAPECH